MYTGERCANPIKQCRSLKKITVLKNIFIRNKILLM